MDKLKTYAVPIVALLLILAWLLVIRPMLNEAGETEAPPAGEQKQGK